MRCRRKEARKASLVRPDMHPVTSSRGRPLTRSSITCPMLPPHGAPLMRPPFSRLDRGDADGLTFLAGVLVASLESRRQRRLFACNLSEVGGTFNLSEVGGSGQRRA